MSKVYVFLADGFEEIEGLTVVGSVGGKPEKRWRQYLSWEEK